MAKFAELRASRHALVVEGAALLDKADKEADGVLSAEDLARVEAIKAETAELDTQIEAAAVQLETEAAKVATEYQRGIDAGLASVAAVIEVCAVADVKAKAILGFVTSQKSAEDVRKEILSTRETGDEISARHGNPNPDKPASWAKAIAKVNAKVEARK